MAYLNWKEEFELESARHEASLQRTWAQLSHLDLVKSLAGLSRIICEGARLHRDSADGLGRLVQMTGVINFLRQSGIHSDHDLTPMYENRPDQQAVGSTLSEFCHSLALAAELHGKQGCQRVGVMSALKAAIDLSRTLPAPIEPLHHIFDELQDLEEGKKPGGLTTPDRTNENAEAGSAKWGLRAALWAVMEIRIGMGERVSTAAKRVCKDCPQAVERLSGKYSNKNRRLSTPSERLIGLRKTIGQGRYPKSANARVIVLTVKECLSAALDAVPNGASPDLDRSYTRMLKEVDRYLNRLSALQPDPSMV